MRRLLSFLPLLMLAAPTGAGAAVQAGTARAVTLKPLSIVKIRDLEFGSLIPSGAGGTVVIDPTNDDRTVTGGVTEAGGTTQAAQFYTYGGPLQLVIITRGPLPTLTRAGGGSMNVTALTLNGATIRFINAAGLLDLRIGGTLAVNPNQPDGVYTGSFNITVDYY